MAEKTVKDIIAKKAPAVPTKADNPLQGLDDGNLFARNHLSNLQFQKGAGSQLPSPQPMAPEAKAAIMAKMGLPSADGAAKPITPALANLMVTLGKDEAGKPVQEDLSSMPHMMIAGQTGSGKTYKMKEMLSELERNNTPDKLKVMAIDPKGSGDFDALGGKYAVMPDGPAKDPETAITDLTWLNGEMNNRLAKGVSDPKIVMAIDELGDLLQNSPASTQRILTSLAQKSRSAGIHMLLGTQRPDATVLKGLMKANIPARMAFKTPDKVNSNIILGRSGAEALEPYQSIYMSPQHGEPQKLFPSSYAGPAEKVVAKEEMGRTP